MNKSLARLLLILVGCALCLSHRPEAVAAEHTLHILATTFPLYQITRNIAAGVDGVTVDLMIPAEMGCPHDYALTPQDMRKLAKAEVLVINGQGMEEFLGAPLRKANSNLIVIDSSQGIDQILQYTEMEEEQSHHRNGKEGAHPDAHPHDGQEQHHGGPNPHLFASPRMAALLTGTIAKALAERHPQGAALLSVNGRDYAERMNRLADDLAALGRRLRNNRIVTQHGVFDYLARDMGLEVVAVVQAHAGQNPSAAEIRTLVATIRLKKAGALFTEPQYPEAIGRTIAKEAGIAAARLDPAANGPEQAPLDYYAQVMRTNLITLEQTLGSN